MTLRDHLFAVTLEQLSPTEGWYTLVIEGGDCWENGDVEGVAIDPDEARVVARYTPEAFVAYFWPDLDSDQEPDGFNVRADWRTA